MFETDRPLMPTIEPGVWRVAVGGCDIELHRSRCHLDFCKSRRGGGFLFDRSALIQSQYWWNRPCIMGSGSVRIVYDFVLVDH